MLRSWLIAVLTASPILFAAAQNGSPIIIQGQVLCENGESASAQRGVLVSAMQDETMSSYTYTDESGNYTLACNYHDGLVIRASFLGYKTREVSIKELHADDNKYSMNCVLEENAFVLDEVVVKPQNIEQDTINIKINAATLLANDNLEKVLQNSANFNIDPNGSISYKGKPIHRILVDGDEFFYHQNSIALEKIELRMIEGIQVNNNYTDRFSSENVYNENETVLNLRANQQLTSVLTGTAAGGYGMNNKYDAELSFMRFAKNNRGFFVSNTNNICRPTISNRDLYALFGDTRPISYIQGNVINAIFTEENRKKDIASTSGLSYIRQWDNRRLNVLLYYLHRDRANAKTYMLNGENLTDTHTSYIQDNYRSHSGFITLNYDIKPKPEHTISYTFSSILANPVADCDNDYVTYDSRFRETIKSYSFYNKLQYRYHINDRMLLSLNTDIYNELSDLQTGLATLSEIRSNDQFRKNQFQMNVGLSYVLHPFVVLSVNAAPSYIDEDMHSSLSQNNVERNYFHCQYSLSALGQKIWDKFTYNLSIGYADISGHDRVTGALKLTYENRLHRLSANFNKNAQIAPFNMGILTLSNNKLFYGNSDHLAAMLDNYSLNLAYSYNSFITGRSLSISSTYRKQCGGYQFNLTDYDRGIETYQTYDNVVNDYMKVRVEGTGLLFSQRIFPVKGTLGLSYSHGRNNSLGANHIPYKVNYDEIAGNVVIRSLSRHLFNFAVYTNYSYDTHHIGPAEYKSHHVDSRVELQMRKNKFEGKFANIFGLDWMFDKAYNRNNFDVGITYKFNNKFHLSLSGENVDQFIPLFDNQSYTTFTRIADGVNQTILYTAAIHYLIIKMKFNF